MKRCLLGESILSYSEEYATTLQSSFDELSRRYRDLQFDLIKIAQEYQSTKAKEHMVHGVCRRIGIIFSTIENIFEIFPPSRTEKLSKKERSDIDINLHAFFININGLLDNIAWVFVYKNKEITGKMLKRHDVGIYKKKTLAILPNDLKELIGSAEIKSWHNKYSKNYRDALAHRIPLYISRSVLTETEANELRQLEREELAVDFSQPEGRERAQQILIEKERLGSICNWFSHSMDDEGKPVLMHPQLLNDYEVISSILNTVIDVNKPSAI